MAKTKKQIIDIGCGKYKTYGSIGLDSARLPGVNIVHDLNKYPWPIKDNQFEEVHCYHLLEHLDDVISPMKEIYRISKHNAKIFIRVPHASCSRILWTDPTHKRGFTIRTFTDYFNSSGLYEYYAKGVNFVPQKIKLNYCIYDGQRETKIPRFWQNLINYLANINFTTQELWERMISNYVGGFEELYVEMVVIKNK